MDGVRGLLIDIDGVLTVSWRPLDGAVAAIRAIRDAGLPIVLVTNTTSRTRERIAGTLADAGFPIGPDDVLTAPAATAAHLREHRPGARCLLLNSGADISADLDGVALVSGPDARPDVVRARRGRPGVRLRRAGRGVRAPAARRRAVRHAPQPVLADRGRPAAGQPARSCSGWSGRRTPRPWCWASRPRAFFDAALATLGVAAGGGGDGRRRPGGRRARRPGPRVTGVLVRTGKFQPGRRARASTGNRPRHVLDSIADLPGAARALTGSRRQPVRRVRRRGSRKPATTNQTRPGNRASGTSTDSSRPEQRECGQLGDRGDDQPGDGQRARQQAEQQPGHGHAGDQQPEEHHVRRPAGQERQVVQRADQRLGR